MFYSPKAQYHRGVSDCGADVVLWLEWLSVRSPCGEGEVPAEILFANYGKVAYITSQPLCDWITSILSFNYKEIRYFLPHSKAQTLFPLLSEPFWYDQSRKSDLCLCNDWAKLTAYMRAGRSDYWIIRNMVGSIPLYPDSVIGTEEQQTEAVEELDQDLTSRDQIMQTSKNTRANILILVEPAVVHLTSFSQKTCYN